MLIFFNIRRYRDRFWSVDKSQDPLVFFAITVATRCSDRWLCVCCLLTVTPEWGTGMTKWKALTTSYWWRYLYMDGNLNFIQVLHIRSSSFFLIRYLSLFLSYQVTISWKETSLLTFFWHFWAPQAECHLIPLYSRESRHLRGRYLQNSTARTF